MARWKTRRPRNLTPEEAREEGERLRKRTEQANLEDAPLLTQRLAELVAEEE